MHIEINTTLDHIEEHDLKNNWTVVNNYNWYWIITEQINNELWFNVFHNPNLKYDYIDYSFSSTNLKECLDYCNISYYEDKYWKYARL